MKLKNKKGLEAEVLIGIIIIIMVSVVIFFFLRGLTWKGVIDREACHQSVLMRSLPSAIGDSLKKTIPLKCKTEKILIDFDDEELIKNRIANAMYDCWWMLGEGKLDFFSETGTFGIEKTSCIICSTLKFDGNVRNKFGEIDLTDYLQDGQIPLKNQTYLEYFSDMEKDSKIKLDSRITPLNTGKEYVILYAGIKSKGLFDPIKQDLQAGATIAGGAFLAKGISGVMNLGSLVFTKIGLTILAGVIATQEILVGAGWIATATYCESSDVSGCNILVLAEYSKEQIEKNCRKIESIP